MVESYTLGAGRPPRLRPGSQLPRTEVGRPAADDRLRTGRNPQLVKAGLWPTQVDYLFFTHHHFDHDIDYPCFLLCRWDQSIGSENQLQVFGPDLTERITEGILGENGLFAHDWKARVNHPLSQQVSSTAAGHSPARNRRSPPAMSGPASFKRSRMAVTAPPPSTSSPGSTPLPTASTPQTAAWYSLATPSPATR